MQTDPQYRDRYWCYQLEEQLRRMEFISHYRRFEIERRKLNLEEPIKSLGKHEVPIKLHREVTALLKIEVLKEE